MAKLHPRLESFGLGEHDGDLVRSFEHGARKAGWSQEQIDGAYGWYRDNASRFAGMSPDAMANSFLEHAAALKLPDVAVTAAFNWYSGTSERLERGEGPEVPPMPTPEQDNARLAELQQLMRDDPKKYWGDPVVQLELYEINARKADAGAPAQPSANNQAATQAPAGRRAEIENMMKAEPDKYWGSPAIQAELRQLIGGDQSMPGAPAAPVVGAAEGGAAGVAAPTGGST